MSLPVGCDLDEVDLKRLKERAEQNGRSLEAEVRTILEREIRQPVRSPESSLEAADRIRSRLGGRKISDSAELIRQARDESQTPTEEKLSHAEALKRLDEFRSRFRGRTFSDSADLIREDRDR